MSPSTLAESASSTKTKNCLGVCGVDIWTGFKPERRASAADIAQTIRDSVTMDEVIRFYSPSTPTRNHRCPCPFHNGKDYNLAYNNQRYKCFVCGESGDVISFVKGICECATRLEAMERINIDFRLNLSTNCSLSAIQSANLALRREAAAKKEAEKHNWWEQYHALMDEWVRLDRMRMEAAPMSDDYAEAVRKLTDIEYQLDCLPPEPR